MSSMQVEASPQAGSFNWRKRLRQDSGSGSESERKTPRLQWKYITLESESPQPSEEDTESVYSVQGQETEFCRDTSDTDSSDSWSSYSVDVGDILMRVEYEVDSDCDKEEKFVFGDGDASSSGTEGVVETATDLLVAAICDSDLAIWADTEDSKSGYSTDSELGRADFWTCIQCKSKNNNPLFRYCEKCYQTRKNFFPPRPKGRKKKRSLAGKYESQRNCSTTAEEDAPENQFSRIQSQDSGIATSLSQESIDLMDLGKIKIPENS
ncbi:E3 ubiquitin-protein ligase Mdm2-like [Ctenocephalides felis]|uniref:E3 ubiquitin-protein ligase Mdm2-like n=1 Tax=Ctenocephalides felis TaxID=7515 RepID=UPI000E6E317D|nr:E3 ubiquitin-protein ligase Mdm2-like [Ctenocephalides felis]